MLPVYIPEHKNFCYCCQVCKNFVQLPAKHYISKKKKKKNTEILMLYQAQPLTELLIKTVYIARALQIL